MTIIIQKAVKHILLSHQAEISGKTYEVLTTFYAKQTQFPKGPNELKIACQKIWPVFSAEQLELFLFQMVISRRRIVGEYLDGY